MTVPDSPVLRITSMADGLQLDAAVVPAGRARVAVVDQDERHYDLVLRGDNDLGVLLRIPPGQASAGRELSADL